MVERRISDAKGLANHVLRGRYPAPLGEVLMKESVCRLAIFVGVSMISVTHHGRWRKLIYLRRRYVLPMTAAGLFPVA